MVSAPATLPSLLQPVPMASWGVPQNQLPEKERIWAWFTDGSPGYTCTTWKWTAVSLQPQSGTSLRDSGEENSFKWALWAAYLNVHFGRRNIQMWDLNQSMDRGQCLARWSGTWTKHPCHHPTGSWTKWPWWQEWRICMGSATWTTVVNQHPTYGAISPIVRNQGKEMGVASLIIILMTH